MFPFLAPFTYELRKYQLVRARDATILFEVSAIPGDHLAASSSSGSLKESARLSPSPPSRVSTPRSGSQPQSSRSTPLPVPDVPVAKQRHRAFEMSSAMKKSAPSSRKTSRGSNPRSPPFIMYSSLTLNAFPDLPSCSSSVHSSLASSAIPHSQTTETMASDIFGGGPDYTAWEKRKQEQVVKGEERVEENTAGVRRFGRKNVFEKERIQTFSDLPLNTTSSIFAEVPDHDRVYEKCQKRVPRRHQTRPDEGGPEIEAGAEEEEGWEVVDPGIPLETEQSPEPTADEEKEDVEGRRKASGDELSFNQPGPDIEQEDERLSSGESAGRQSAGAETQSDKGEEEAASGAGDGGGEDEMSVLVRGAQIVNDDSVFVADVLVQGGVITAVGTSVEAPPGIRIIDGEGKILMPAGIDVHTHFSSPHSADDVGRGSKAAVAGGTATVVETAWPAEGEGLLEAIRRVKKTAESEAVCNVAISGVIAKWDDNVKRAVKDEHVNSFIVDVEEDDVLFQILSTARSLGVHIRVLPERKCIVRLLEARMLELGITGPEGFLQSRPEDLEGEKVTSLCVLSKLTNCPVSVLQLSSAEASRSLQEGRASSSLIHAEVATAALATDGTHYFNKCHAHAAAHLTESPLRPDGSSAHALLHVLANCPLSVVASGHRAVASSQRTAKRDFTAMPRGVAAAEERMAVLWEKAVRAGRIDAMRFVALSSSNAAKIFNLYPKKGRVAVGADGDLVLWEVAGAKRALGKGGQTAADSSPFEGMNVHSRATATIVGGRVAWMDGAVKEGKGRIVETRPNSPYLYGVVQQREKLPMERVDRGGDSRPIENGSSSSSHPVITGKNVKNKNLESSISFGDANASSRAPVPRARNPPGGRTTGLW